MNFRYLIPLILILFLTDLNSQSTVSQNVTKFRIEAPQLDTIKTIWVYLPKNYKNSQKSYPVIYMHDAQNLFDKESSYAGEWQVDEFLDTMTSQESIIVGIEHGNEKRILELTPFSHDKYGGGKGDQYLNFLRFTLKPHIDATYRTLPDPKNTVIFGSSLGGLISFYAILVYPDVYGSAGIFSPSFWFNESIYDLASKTKIPSTTRFFFLAGTDESEDMVNDLKKMINTLRSNGLNSTQIKSMIIEDGKHNEALWAKYFPVAYNWINN